MSDDNLPENDEKLLGDVTAEVLQKLRADKVAAAYARATGKPCNCGKRKDRLNQLHRQWRLRQQQQKLYGTNGQPPEDENS